MKTVSKSDNLHEKASRKHAAGHCTKSNKQKKRKVAAAKAKTVLTSNDSEGISPTSTARATMRKQPWTKEEDARLRELVAGEGGVAKSFRWASIADMMTGRTGKQCRERWQNHLRPNIKKGDWTAEEDSQVVKLQKIHGNSWTVIASYLPLRTDNDIKNRWHSKMRAEKRRQQRAKKSTDAAQAKVPEATPSKKDTAGLDKSSAHNQVSFEKAEKSGTASSTRTANLNAESPSDIEMPLDIGKGTPISFTPLFDFASPMPSFQICPI